MYQALYRKYRPQTFDEVVGQKSVTDTLKAQLRSGRLSHAYLFTGTRGTGKTSCAKILARAVNCENPIDGNPCNRCTACRSIASGACMDVQEIDAASNSGVDNVRALRDDAIYTPAEVKKRVYIIDEVHMLSISAFNALLKTLEEPPEHMLFILATTELHKVPATILSRCQRYSFRRLLAEDICGRIHYVAQCEQISIEPQAVELLARLADGALRDGMSLLDQCASSVSGIITPQSVYQCLGLAGLQTTAEILQAVAARDVKKALSLFFDAYAAGKSLTAMLDELLSLARDLLVFRITSGDRSALSFAAADVTQLQELNKRFTAEELLQIIQLLQQTAFNLSKSANQRIDAELCLIRLCTPALSADLTGLDARLSRLEETVRTGVVVAASQQTVPEQPPLSVPEPKQSLQEQSPLDVPEPKRSLQEQPPLSVSEPGRSLRGQPARPVQQPKPLDSWAELSQQLHKALRPPINSFFTGDALVGTLQEGNLLLQTRDFFVKNIVERQSKLIAQKVSELLGREIHVTVTEMKSDKSEPVGKFDDIISFGRQHSEIITIHQSE